MAMPSGFAALLDAADGPLVLPGVGTPLEALAAVRAGFPGIYLSGYATAGWQSGKPDIGLTGLREVLDCLTAIGGRVPQPVLVDADTGYGDVSNVADTVRRLERAGAAGVQLEDQTWPKRCGHLDGKTVEPVDVMVRKLRAALAARSGPGLFVVARTDARSPLGLDEAISRAQTYAEVGADAVFVDAPHSVDELRRIGAEVPGRLVVNISESGLTPSLPAAELGALGFDLVLYPTGALRAAAAAVQSYFGHLREAGTSSAWAGPMLTLGAFNELVGLTEFQLAEADLL
ncbi:MAG TPA: oxaloacetate decarboxylase [Mycobacteriales bacterium]|jgi:methylisocitrate lyase|nr:oxaloacetate decarboxylase [Mycobacteriales bacterium]